MFKFCVGRASLAQLLNDRCTLCCSMIFCVSYLFYLDIILCNTYTKRRLTPCDFLFSFAANGDYDSQRQAISKTHPTNSPTDVRQTQVFHGYPNFPSNHGVGAAIPPSIANNMDSLAGHTGSAQTAVAASVPKTEDEDRKHSLFGDVPEAKRRKFILVDDPDRNSRVRVRVMLDQVNMKELPDQYRKTNSVYPRSYFPIQMQSPPRSAKGSRFFEDDDPDGGPEFDEQATRGRTLVPIPLPGGPDGDITVPKISRAKKGKEIKLNDLGYRMNWSQSRVFAGRTMFLQKAREPISMIKVGA